MGILDAPSYSRTAADKRFPIRATTFQTRENALYTWGHSYVDGQGTSDRSRRFGQIVAEALGLREQNESISGTAWTADNSGGSYSKVLQNIARQGLGGVSGSATAASGLHGFGSPQNLHLWMCGVNDLNVYGNTSGVLAPFTNALRVALSRWRATAVYEDSHSSFSYGGSWSTPSDILGSGSGYHMTASGAATWSIAVPADFPGGTLAIGFRANAGAGAGATHSVTVDGGAPLTVDAHGISGTSTAFVLRIPNLAAGAHTISGTIGSLVTATCIDYWQHEADTSNAPLCVLVKQPYPVDYSLYGSVAPGPPTNAGVDVLNGLIASVAAEFDSRVIVVDTSSLNGQVDSTLYCSDHLHPSDKGHLALANLILAAIKAAGFTVVPGSDIRAPRIYYGTAVPTGTRTKYEIGDVVRNTAPAVLGTTGSQYVIVEWRCYVGGRPGSWAPITGLTGT